MSDCLFKSKQYFKFLEKICSINSDGEKYISVSVLSNTNKKFSFVSHDENLIQEFQNLQIENLSDIILIVGFDKVFNSRTRFSNWQPVLLGVEQ